MCWVTQNSENGKVMTAEKDIEVYKIVKVPVDPKWEWRSFERTIPDDATVNEATAWFFGFHYETGKTYSGPTELDGKTSVDFQGFYAWVWKAFHSYDPEKCPIEVARVNPPNVRVQTGHSWQFYYSTWANYCFVPVIMHCVIPKGAQYVLNLKGEYASNSIRVESMEFPRKNKNIETR